MMILGYDSLDAMKALDAFVSSIGGARRLDKYIIPFTDEQRAEFNETGIMPEREVDQDAIKVAALLSKMFGIDLPAKFYVKMTYHDAFQMAWAAMCIKSFAKESNICPHCLLGHNRNLREKK